MRKIKNKISSEMVAVMIPCFNGEKYLPGLFQCFKEQRYKNIHIIFADDGSTDQSAHLIKEFAAEMNVEKPKMKVDYLYQVNKGLAGAINLALTAVDELTDKYVTWMDVDDEIEATHIYNMVTHIQEREDTVYVMCKGEMFLEECPEKIVGVLGRHKTTISAMEDILFHYENCTPGLYLIKTSALLSCLPEKRIYDKNKRMGQNMQLLLPVANKFGAPLRIDSTTFRYRIRTQSLSHKDNHSLINLMQYIDHIMDIKYNVVNSLVISKYYSNLLQKKLAVHEALWKMNEVFRFGEEGEEYYFDIWKELCKEYNRKKRLLIWGFYEYSQMLYKVLRGRVNSEIEILFVESDNTKWNDIVVGKDEINKKSDFVYVPLEYHEEILAFLSQNDMQEEIDFCYPIAFLRKKNEYEDSIRRYE